jgi:hypothetical protein
MISPEARSSDGKSGLAWVHDLQPLAAWDDAERNWRAGVQHRCSERDHRYVTKMARFALARIARQRIAASPTLAIQPEVVYKSATLRIGGQRH